MARRLVNTTLVNEQDTYTFELYDMDSVSVDLDYVVEFDSNGFEISWRGGEADTPIMSSTMSWTMFLTEAQRSAIMPVVFSDTEFRLCVRVLRNGQTFWAGCVHPEETSEVIGDGTITVSLRASDGLAMLSNANWVDGSGNRYSGRMKARDVIWQAINKLPHLSLLGTTGYACLKEHQLVQPIMASSSYLFNPVNADGNKYGVLDHLTINPNTFYYSTIEEDKVVYGQSFTSIDKFNPEQFTNSLLVIKDVMSSLGATICYADGAFHVFDKTQMFNTDYDNSYDIFEWYLTSSGDLDTLGDITVSGYYPSLYDKGALNYAGIEYYNGRTRVDFLKGIARKASHSVRGVTQRHVRAGSDLLYANGLGHWDGANRENWRADEGYERKLLDFFRYSRGATADSSDADYVGSFFSGSGNSWDGLFNDRLRERVITDIQIPNAANDGAIRINISGNANYTKKNVTGQVETWGSLAIYKMRVEAYDGVTRYRLSRPVRTLTYDSYGADADVDITGTGATRYQVKVWQGVYSWVPQTDPEYSEAWLDIPMGATNSIMDEGIATKFMQSDYPALDCFTPPLTKLQADSDNILTKEDNGDRTYYAWTHDFVYDTPSASGTIQELKIHQPCIEEWHSDSGPNMIYSSAGATLDLGTHSGSPTYRTASTALSSDGTGAKPNSLQGFELHTVEVYYGDGTQEFDQNAVAFPNTPQGRQIMNMNGTRLGASFVNLGGSTHGRYHSGNLIDINANEASLKFQRGWDISVQKESLGELVTLNYLEMRGRVNELVIGTMQYGFGPSTGEAPLLLPFRKLVTDKLATTTKVLIPLEVTFSPVLGTQRFKAWMRNTTALANIGSTTVAEQDGTRGPAPASGNTEKPSGNDLSDFVVAEATSGAGGVKPQFGDIFPIFIKG